MTVRDIYEYLNSVAQFKTQEDWDNSGIMAGDFDDEVKKILFALDFTPEVVKEAEELGCTLIVNHHPA
ncbi:MAG: Nif3-like dinuclear metal center hexameric protein, partial [Oscillospiraceae bacterium]|nr:Nif3-like dinuclear metal center hexameric protein [Oscillospiraceae bacterium]